MIRFNELQIGDLVRAEFEGKAKEGEITNLNRDEKQVCILSGEQEFWFDASHLHPIPLDDEQLKNLNFTRQDNEDGTVKYMKGPFRILLHRKGDFNNFEMWYREDKRHFNNHLMVHEVQNHYLQMTKVHLTKEILA